MNNEGVIELIVKEEVFEIDVKLVKSNSKYIENIIQQ
jgi:hypothetical protein